MSERPVALSWEEQLKLFKDRGMKVRETDIDKLKNISYYRLKEFARPLATMTNNQDQLEISYNGIEFREVLTRYYQDKNLRINLLHAIEKIEVSVKTRVSYVLGAQYGAFGYLDFSSWSNKKKFSRFEIEKKQYSIKKRMLKILSHSQLSDLKNKRNLDKDGFPLVWLGIDLMMFGDLVAMLTIMGEANLRQVASYYKCSGEELVSWMKCLNFIRNICAHNSNLIDLKVTTKPKIRREWGEYLYYIESTNENQTIRKPSNKLAVIIIIVVELVNQINSKYKWQNIQSSICSLCKNEERAFLLGFSSLDSARKITSLVKNNR
ncbi:Abi family protein [Streptococcus sobrinus]|uniref:Abi family protein n=1 Tax=Streptococcus sobrinus TaxID=1310 RepID=UPI0002F44DAF|nr:Abi family protein [Streptococcus sobrinus]